MAIEEPAIRPSESTIESGASGAGVSGEAREESIRDEAPLPVKWKRSWAEPTAEETERHSKYHCPFRAWCEFCVRGKFNNDGHDKQPLSLIHI